MFDSEFNVVYIRVVQGCNLNCTHCFTNGNKDPFRLASLEDIQMYLEAISKNVDPQKIVFYIHGGETFLAPLSYLREVNSLIRSIFEGKEIHIIPQTNLLIQVNEEVINFFKEEYLSEVGVSWDYKIRFNNSDKLLSEERFFKNLKILIDHDINVAIAITVQKHLLKSDYRQVLKSFEGVKSIDFELLTIFDKKTQRLKVSNIEWSKFLMNIVNYYIEHETTWSLPQIDLFTKSIKENKLYRCKCDCCNNRTFTMNPDGSVGLCPDKAYYEAFSSAQKMYNDWGKFADQASFIISERESSKVNRLCLECEYYDLCGGNCEDSLFVEGEEECPLSKAVIGYQVRNIEKFKHKLTDAYKNLPELNA